MKKEELKQFFEQKNGLLNLTPIFIPRRFGSAGRRLKLHPDDYYAYGTNRGSIKERWFSSVISPMNGDNAKSDEGLSYVNTDGTLSGKVLLKDFIDSLGAEILGDKLFKKYGTWPMYSKFFDYEGALFHHVHLDFESAARVGKIGKPEAYYYPPQLNNYPGLFPHTYFGFVPGTTKEEVKNRLKNYEKKDIKITELSRAYRIELGTGWYTPPGVLHAPGSYLTYEPQWNSDVNSVFENITDNEVYPKSFLNENCPQDKSNDLDYIMGLLDWDKNVDPNYRNKFFREPFISSEDHKHIEKWIAYGNDYIAAKELTVFPGQTVTVKDDTAYGLIMVQGHGRINGQPLETPVMLRFGQFSRDEYFVGYGTASSGVTLTNESDYDNLVMLKHFPSDEKTPKAK